MSERIHVDNRIGRYEVEAEVGRGGMGLVYRCYDPVHERQVALKLMAAHLSDNDTALARFRREAALVASLKHAHIATFHEFGEWASRPYFVMDWVDGRTLKDELATHHKLPLARCLALFAQLADAIGHAHAHGVIHRDLKPANIIIGPDDQATIVDFGVALLDTAPSLTTTGLIVGTPLYMSPEQIRGQDVDGRSDQYSLAVILYEMLTGQFPYEAISVPAIYHHQLLGQPIPISERDPRLPAAIEAALNQALAKEPARRFATVADFNRALRRRAPRKTGPRPESHYLHPEPRWQQTFEREITAVYPGPSHIFVVTAHGQLAALAAISGDMLWQVEVDGRITHLVQQQDIVAAVTAVGSLCAWQVGDGRTLWQHPLNQEPLALHLPNQHQLLLVLPQGELVYLNLADGQEMNRLTLSTGQPATMPSQLSGEELLFTTAHTIASYAPPKEEA